MEDKKPRVLDILRLIVGILTFAGATLVGISLFIAVYNLFSVDHSDGFSGLIFIFIIPLMIGAIAYSIIGLKWIKKYNKIKNIPLIKRTISTGECIVKIALAIFFLSYLCIPFVVYWVIDLIEAIMRNKLVQGVKQDIPKQELKINPTNLVNDTNRCKSCGQYVDVRYARFCEHCGAEIEYRK